MGEAGASILDSEVEVMLNKQAIHKVEAEEDEVVSSFFAIPKKTPGKWIPICSLIYTNRFIRKTKFRMTTTQMLKSWIRPGYFFILINLQDAYFTILLAKEACRFCRFTSKGTTFEYLCLMFGLGSSARVYAKLVKVVLTFLRI